MPVLSQIRRATVADAPAVAQVHLDSWVATYTGVLPQATFDSLPLVSRVRTWTQAAQAMDEPQRRTQLLLAEDEDGAVLGFVSLGPFRDTGGEGGAGDAGRTPKLLQEVGELYAIYLAPTARRRGTGRALFAACAAALRDAGFAEMRLWAIDANPEAIAFYTAMGCTPCDHASFTTHGATLTETCLRLAL